MPLHIVRNDITKMQVDAIVNAANESLLGGGGVDGCIHRAAGPELLAECRTLGGCTVGQAKLTGGYRLPCRYVIHTVGPRWHGGAQDEPELLRACYRNALALAAAQECETVAFPLISSGVFGYPKDKALRVAVEIIGAFLAEHEMTVYLVVFDRKAYQIGETLFADIAAYIDDQYVEEHTDGANRSRDSAFFDVWSGEAASASITDQDEAPYQDEDIGEAEQPVENDEADILPDIDDILEMLNLREDAAESAKPPAAESHTVAASAASEPTEGRVEKKPSAGAWHTVQPAPMAAQQMAPAMQPLRSLNEELLHLDESFSEMLLRKIDEAGITGAQCYKKANIDRKLFSKIRSDKQYRPSKPTALAFAIALELPLSETRELLEKAGFALSRSSKFDIIVEYFIRHGNYNVFEINEALFAFEQNLLGA